jgi:AcrR family transcriptional regulator
MSPRSPEQFAALRADAQLRIERAALRVFSRSGYASATIRDISREAGVSQGLLYNYYRAKEELLAQIFRRGMADVAESFSRGREGGTPHERLARLIHGAFEIVKQNREFWRLFYGLRFQAETLETLRPDVAQWNRIIQRTLAAHLRAVGHSRPRAAVLARVAFAAIDGVAQHYTDAPRSYPIERVAEELVRVLAVRQ